MAIIQQHIAKGVYQYSQIENFISVKDYMLVRSDDKKCLMFRFANNADYTITAMNFTITQLDNSGKVIATTKHMYESLTIAPDAQFVPDEGIVVDEKCHDFKVSFTEVRSDKYRYTVKNGKIQVFYDEDYTRITTQKVSNRAECRNVRKLKIGKPKVAVFIAAFALFLVIVANAANMIMKYYDYSNKDEPDWQEDKISIMTNVAIPGEYETFVYYPVESDEYESFVYYYPIGGGENETYFYYSPNGGEYYYPEYDKDIPVAVETDVTYTD